MHIRFQDLLLHPQGSPFGTLTGDFKLKNMRVAFDNPIATIEILQKNKTIKADHHCFTIKTPKVEDDIIIDDILIFIAYSAAYKYHSKLLDALISIVFWGSHYYTGPGPGAWAWCFASLSLWRRSCLRYANRCCEVPLNPGWLRTGFPVLGL